MTQTEPSVVMRSACLAGKKKDFFADFVAGFFLLIFVGKSAQKNPPGKSPAKSSRIYTAKIPDTFLQRGRTNLLGGPQKSPRKYLKKFTRIPRKARKRVFFDFFAHVLELSFLQTPQAKTHILTGTRPIKKGQARVVVNVQKWVQKWVKSGFFWAQN